MTRRNPLLQTHVAENPILLLIISSHAYFLSHFPVQGIVSFSALCEAGDTKNLCHCFAGPPAKSRLSSRYPAFRLRLHAGLNWAALRADDTKRVPRPQCLPL